MIVGLRIRVVALLAISCAVALGVVAVALLGPLESRLVDDEIENLRIEAQRDLPVLVKAAGEPPRPSPALQLAAQRLQRSGGAEVSVVRADGTVLATTDPDLSENFPDAVDALRGQRIVKGRIGTGFEEEISIAVPVDREIAVAFRKPLDDVRSAVSVVRRAFLVAAIASLVVAVLLGSLLAGRLIHRVRVLRDAALDVAEHGPTEAFVADRARDEIGDLSRSFSTMQQRLHAQENARRTFVATASHELRTPLTSLRIMLDLARDVLGEPVVDIDEARRQVALADQQAARLAGLSVELLDLSRLDAGVPLRSEDLELGEIASLVVGEFQPQAQEAGRSLVVAGAKGVWAIGDPGSVAQITRLLIDNALRYGAGAIEVTTAKFESTASLTVQDAGPGVPASESELIFERFQRGTALQSGSGFGLGLAIGRELALHMGGDLILRQGGPPTIFHLKLPSSSEHNHVRNPRR